MAFFEGSYDEFNKYIGPLARNVVQKMTKDYKGGKVCEMCHKSVKELDAAHIHGEERKQKIFFILNSNYKVGSGYRVDLNDFFIKFKESHLPIEKHFKFLCKECHKKYDSERRHMPSIEAAKKHLDSLSIDERKKLLQEMGLTLI